MSRMQTNPSTDAAADSGGAIVTPEAQEKSLAGGAFRLDAMSPGTEAEGTVLSAPKKPNIVVQLGFFAVLLVAAGGVVYSMRKMGIGPLKAFAATKMPDYDVTRSTALGADHQKVLNDLQRASSAAQVPADQVQKNPFRLADSMNNSAEDDAADAKKTEQQRLAAAARVKRDAEARAKAIEAKLNTIKIHSIMRGATPVARVNEDFVRVGDTIDELFLVKAINERSIEVDADGVTYLLSLDEPAAAKGAPRSGRRK